MNFKFLFLLFSLFCHSIVEGDGGGATEETTSTTDAGGQGGDAPNTDEGGGEEPSTPEADVLDAIGLNEDGTKKEEEEPAAAAAAEPEKPDGDKPPEQETKPDAEAGKKGALTEDDLKPLESKNVATNERFRKVTEGYRQEKDRADNLQAEVQRMQGSFQALNQLGFKDEAAAHDLVTFSEYRHALAVGDDEAFTKMIAGQVRQFESMHGKRITINASALDAHEDLRERVTALDLDEAAALEIAHARDINARASREQKAQQEHSRQQQDSQAILNQVVASVETLQATWQKNDPDFPAILPHLRPAMEEIGAKYHPTLWPQMLELQYKTIKKALVESGQQTRGSGQQALRGTGHMTGKPAPSTPQEAVLQELGLDG